MAKSKVSQDFLYEIINENGVNITTLAELMDMSRQMVSGCLCRNKDKNGIPRSFPERTLPKLNEGLATMAAQMREKTLTFGSDQTYTNQRGATYDPACVESIMALHRFFKLTKFLKQTLGWSEGKKSMVLHAPSSKAYGCISRDDVERINARILSVAGMFEGIEVIPASDSSKE